LPLALPGGQRSVAFERQGQELVSVSSRGCGFMVLQGDFAPAPGTRIQIGPDPNLSLSFRGERALPVTADRFAGWLSESRQAWATGVTATMGEIGDSFFAWMALQVSLEEETAVLRASLSARGDLADQGVIPALFGVGGEWKSRGTIVLIEADGAAAMMRPPGQIPPLVDVNHPQDHVPFEVYVRQLGPGTHAAQCFVSSIQEWDRAGRPEPRWHIRALPADMAYTPAEDEFLLDQEWAKLVIRYQ